MPSKSSAVLQLRVAGTLKEAFTDAARREQTTPSRAMRTFMEAFVRDSRRREAERQSRIVAEAADEEETMRDIAAASEWMYD